MSQAETQETQDQNPELVYVDGTNMHTIESYPIPNILKCIVRYALARKFYGTEYKPCATLIRQSFDTEAQYKVFRSIQYKHLYGIWFNDTYVALKTYQPHYSHGELTSYTTLIYVVGLMTNGKLFIHLVDENTWRVEYGDQPPQDDVVQLQYNKHYGDFFELLGYAHDAELSNVNEVMNINGTSVRVQGDVVFSIGDANIRDIIERMLLEQIFNLARMFVLRRLQDKLLDYGISMDGARIPMWKLPRKPDKISDFRFKLRHFLTDLMNSDNDVVRLVGKVTIDVRIPLDPFEVRAINVYVEFSDLRNSQLYRELLDTAVNEFTTHRGRYTINLGRHVINYIGYPQHLTVVVDHEVVGRVILSIDFNENAFIAEEVLMTHPQHAPFHYRFDKPKLIIATNVRNQSIPHENYYTLMEILRKYRPMETEEEEEYT